jgi:hypothetical protein
MEAKSTDKENPLTFLSILSNQIHKGAKMDFLNPFTTQPNELKAGDKLCYVVVAVVRDANDWAAYAGLAGTSPEKVATNGGKIDRKAAEALFPVCINAGLKWRS